MLVHGDGPDPLAALYADSPVAPVEVSFADRAALLFTSGTTGRSKACVLSHRYFLTQATILLRDFELRHDDVLYCPFPLFHADATALTTVPALLLGATAAIGRRFSASRFWDEVREHGATVFDFMGATLAILHKAEPRPDDADNPARLAWGVPVPEWVEAFEARFGLRVVELYGSVEASIPVTQDLSRPRVPGSCGRVTEGFDVRIHDEADEPVAPGVPGELVVRPWRASTILDGYFGMPEATAEAFRNLWFHSGDTARIDADGNVFFVGRRKDAIRRRGENISAFEVEEGILLHPDVLECAAVGVPSELTEEDVKVVVVPRPGSALTPEAVLAHAERTLARFQVPRFIEFADTLPKTPTGKIAKHLLARRRDRLGSRAGGRVMTRWASFDCYGTLVDWEAGMRGALGDDALLAAYHEAEREVQAAPFRALPRGARGGVAPRRRALWRRARRRARVGAHAARVAGVRRRRAGAAPAAPGRLAPRDPLQRRSRPDRRHARAAPGRVRDRRHRGGRAGLQARPRALPGVRGPCRRA